MSGGIVRPRIAAITIALAALGHSDAVAQAPQRSAGATDSAAWVVEMFYARPTFPTLSSHITAEHRECYADAALVGDLRDLRLGALLRLPRYPGCIFLKIGGSGDDQVGFMHAPPGCRAPAPSPVEFIYIEEVAPGWYVYRTT